MYLLPTHCVDYNGHTFKPEEERMSTIKTLSFFLALSIMAALFICTGIYFLTGACSGVTLSTVNEFQVFTCGVIAYVGLRGGSSLAYVACTETHNAIVEETNNV